MEKLLYDRTILSRMTKYDIAHHPHAVCQSAAGGRKKADSPSDIMAYFNSSIDELFVSCKDNGAFSHCQPFYLFQFNTITQQCQTFQRQPCGFLLLPSPIDRFSSDPVNITLTTQFSYVRYPLITLSLNRINRFAFILQRWSGDVSAAVFVQQSKVDKLAERMLQFASERRVVFTVYVQKTIDPERRPYYLTSKRKKRSFSKGLYPMNLLRDLAIESIQTTHYCMIDVDVFLSSTLYNNLFKYADMLEDHNVVMFIPLFEYENSTALLECYNHNDCDRL